VSVQGSSTEDLEAQDFRGMTPLLLAAAVGHAGVVAGLLKKGCARRESSSQSPGAAPRSLLISGD
jgi:ankyrin repeat protein